MPKYLVLEKSFIDNRIVEAGEEVEYDSEPGPNLELVAGETAYKAPAKAEDAARDKTIEDAKLKAKLAEDEAKAKAKADEDAKAKGRDEHGHPRPGDKPLA